MNLFVHNKHGRYRIQQGSFDDFAIDNRTGLISIARKLDYDKRENYRIEVVASDLGKSANLISFSLNFHWVHTVVQSFRWIEMGSEWLDFDASSNCRAWFMNNNSDQIEIDID